MRHRRSRGDLGFGLGQGFVFLAGEKAGEFFRMEGDEIEPPAQEARALLAGQLFPPGEGRLRCHDRGLAVLSRTIGDAGKEGAIRRIGDVKAPRSEESTHLPSIKA